MREGERGERGRGGGRGGGGREGERRGDEGRVRVKVEECNGVRSVVCV